jgi:hypothetical protein
VRPPCRRSSRCRRQHEEAAGSEGASHGDDRGPRQPPRRPPAGRHALDPRRFARRRAAPSPPSPAWARQGRTLSGRVRTRPRDMPRHHHPHWSLRRHAPAVITAARGIRRRTGLCAGRRFLQSSRSLYSALVASGLLLHRKAHLRFQDIRFRLIDAVSPSTNSSHSLQARLLSAELTSAWFTLQHQYLANFETFSSRPSLGNLDALALNSHRKEQPSY